MTTATVTFIDPETLERRKGSSLDLFIRKALEQEWTVSVASGRLDSGKVVPVSHWDPNSVVVTAERYDLSKQIESGAYSTRWPHRVQAQYDTPSGIFTTGVFWKYQTGRGLVQERFDLVDKARTAQAHLEQGPLLHREQAKKVAATAEAEARRRGTALNALAAAAATEEVERWKTQVAHDLFHLDRRIKEAVESVQTQATETLAAIKEGGRATGTFGGGPFAGNNSVSEANTLAGKREELLRTKEHLEFLFGPLPKVAW